MYRVPNHLVRLSTHARREISVGMARQRRELSEEFARQLRSQPERQPSTTAVVTAASASAATIDTVEDATFRSYSSREAATRDAIDGSSAFSAAKPRSSVQSTCSGDLTLGGVTSSADAKM